MTLKQTICIFQRSIKMDQSAPCAGHRTNYIQKKSKGRKIMTEEEIASRMTEIDQRSQSNTHRIDKVEARQDDLDKIVTSVAVLAKEQEGIKSDVKEIKGDVKQMIDQPRKHWQDLIGYLLAALVSAGVTLILTKIFK